MDTPSLLLPSPSDSPDFHFWSSSPSSFTSPHLLSADELFSHGLLLPLDLLHLNTPSDPDPPCPDLPEPDPEPGTSSNSDPSPSILSEPSSSSSAVISASKRWKDIFKKSENKEKDKDKKKERRNGGGGGGAELNINIWPFSRSRSAGNNSGRPRAASVVARRVSSAPCSRSNSAGESKSRKWPSSPSRAGVHLGRSSPVWQVSRVGKSVKKEGLDSRRSKAGKDSAAPGTAVGGGGGKGRGLSIGVPMCMGYRQHLNCRSDENSAIRSGNGGAAAAIGGRSGGAGDGESRNVGGSGNNLFNLRSLFTKKVY